MGLPAAIDEEPAPVICLAAAEQPRYPPEVKTAIKSDSVTMETRVEISTMDAARAT